MSEKIEPDAEVAEQLMVTRQNLHAMAKEVTRGEADILALHSALNDLLALFWQEAKGLNVNAQLDALARRSNLPLTVAFAAEVKRRALLAAATAAQ